VVLVAGLLVWRYGARGAFWTILPPITAALLVPAVISLVGEPFTFFHAMGAGSCGRGSGSDYTIFCAETPLGHHSVTMLAILLATITTLLSFGLLGVSSVLAVRAFGFTMVIGIIAAYLLAPLASPRGYTSPVQMILRYMPTPTRLSVPSPSWRRAPVPRRPPERGQFPRCRPRRPFLRPPAAG